MSKMNLNPPDSSSDSSSVIDLDELDDVELIDDLYGPDSDEAPTQRYPRLPVFEPENG